MAKYSTNEPNTIRLYPYIRIRYSNNCILPVDEVFGTFVEFLAIIWPLSIVVLSPVNWVLLI
jgi:hypothetical protein